MPAPSLPPGLYPRPDSTGENRWRVQIVRKRRTPDGRRERKVWRFHLGAIPRREAEAKHREVHEIADRWKMWLGPPTPVIVGHAFGEVGWMYRDMLIAGMRRPRAIDTVESDLRILEHHAGFWGKPIATIQADGDIETFKKAMLGRVSKQTKKPIAPRTVEKYLETAGAVFNYGIRKGYCRFNPVKAVDPIRSEEPEYKDVWDLHPREDSRLLTACEDWVRCAVGVSLYMRGMRISTVLRRKIDDIDLLNEWNGKSNPCMRVLGKDEKGSGRKGKARKTEWAPIPRRILALLKEQMARARAVGSEWLFPSPDGSAKPVWRSTLYRKFREAAASVGLDMTFHDLRHLCDGRIKDAGLDDRYDRAHADARRYMKHDSKSASSRYSRRSANALRPICDRMEAFLDSQIRASKRAESRRRCSPDVPQKETRVQ